MAPIEPWLAHEHPERPPDTWCWFCACVGCCLALVVAAHAEPRLAIALKTWGDRIVVPAEVAAATWLRTGSLDELLVLEDDAIREVFVAAIRVMPPGLDSYVASRDAPRGVVVALDQRRRRHAPDRSPRRRRRGRAS